MLNSLDNKSKKIAFFAPNLAGGGAERVVSVLAAHFADNGYIVDLVLAEAKGPYLTDIPSSVRIVDLKSSKVLYSLPKLVKYMRKEQPVVLFSSQMHASTIALWASALAGFKTRVFIRQPTMLMPSYERKNLTSRLKQKIFLKTANLAEKVIVTSETMAAEFQSLSGINKEKIEVIYNPVPVEVIRAKSFDRIEHSWFKEEQPPVILAVGRLVKVKNFDVLIKAFSMVRKDSPARLIILGEGPLRGNLEQLIKGLGIAEDVVMPGFVHNPYQYMRHAKVFVLSSLWEGFPNGMVEAMACDMAIVATDCEGGTAEVLEQGKWGELVPVSDESAMAKAILKALTFDNFPNVAERVEDFSTKNIVMQYSKVFEIDKPIKKVCAARC